MATLQRTKVRIKFQKNLCVRRLSCKKVVRTKNKRVAQLGYIKAAMSCDINDMFV